MISPEYQVCKLVTTFYKVSWLVCCPTAPMAMPRIMSILIAVTRALEFQPDNPTIPRLDSLYTRLTTAIYVHALSQVRWRFSITLTSTRIDITIHTITKHVNWRANKALTLGLVLSSMVTGKGAGLTYIKKETLLFLVVD